MRQYFMAHFHEKPTHEMLTNLGVEGHEKCHGVAMKIIMANSVPFHRNMPSSEVARCGQGLPVSSAVYAHINNWYAVISMTNN